MLYMNVMMEIAFIIISLQYLLQYFCLLKRLLLSSFSFRRCAGIMVLLEYVMGSLICFSLDISSLISLE